MIRYFAYAFLVASTLVLPSAAVAGAQGMIRVAMLEFQGPEDLPGERILSPRNVENVALGLQRYRSPVVIHSPTYFPASRQYELWKLRNHQRLQGYGFGAGSIEKPR